MPAIAEPRFAYMTNDGHTILVEEVGREIQEALSHLGFDIHLPTALSIIESARKVTEEIAQGILCNNPEHFLSHVQKALKSKLVLLPEATIQQALKALMQTLGALDVARVHYFTQ